MTNQPRKTTKTRRDDDSSPWPLTVLLISIVLGFTTCAVTDRVPAIIRAQQCKEPLED